MKRPKKTIDKGGTFNALLTDLSKAFDCMTHDLLIAKLHALNFDMNALNMKQRVKINSRFSSYVDIFQGIPQGSILGPLLFNLFLCDLFLFVEEVDIMSYSDDNTPYVCSENVDVTLEKLEEVGKVLLEWFSNNFLKANAALMNEIFVKNAQHYYDLRKKTEFKRKKVKTVYNGTETLTFLGPRIWEIVPDYIKKVAALRNLN